MMKTLLTCALALVLAGAGCTKKVDLEKVPVGTQVQVTRQDGGVVQGTLAARDDTTVKVKVGPVNRSVPRDQIADVQLVAETPAPLPVIAKFREFTIPAGTTLAVRLGSVREVSELVGMVDRQTEGIAHSTSMIQTSVDRVKAGRTEFAGDARANGTELQDAQKRLAHLENMSNTMLDTLANSGAEIDDTPFILKAQEACRQIQASIEHAVDSGEVSLEDVFDRDYQAIEGSNPVQFTVRFNAAADKLVRPVLDRTKASDSRIIGSAIGDMNGYLPTHLSERSHPQGPDPNWNDEHCRNMRILIRRYDPGGIGER